MKKDFKDVAIRSAKTFVQAFLASLAAGTAGVVDMNSAKALAIASLAAAFAATVNILIKAFQGE